MHACVYERPARRPVSQKYMSCFRPILPLFAPLFSTFPYLPFWPLFALFLPFLPFTSLSTPSCTFCPPSFCLFFATFAPYCSFLPLSLLTFLFCHFFFHFCPFCQCPLLCKEFIVDAWQIYFARLKGADAILLIAAVLPNQDLKYLSKIAKALGMASLIEVGLINFLPNLFWDWDGVGFFF